MTFDAKPRPSRRVRTESSPLHWAPSRSADNVPYAYASGGVTLVSPSPHHARLSSGECALRLNVVMSEHEKWRRLWRAYQDADDVLFVRTGRGRQTLTWICPPASPDAAKSGVGDEMSVPGSKTRSSNRSGRSDLPSTITPTNGNSPCMPWIEATPPR
jgi:hypothetical protein